MNTYTLISVSVCTNHRIKAIWDNNVPFCCLYSDRGKKGIVYVWPYKVCFYALKLFEGLAILIYSGSFKSCQNLVYRDLESKNLRPYLNG